MSRLRGILLSILIGAIGLPLPGPSSPAASEGSPNPLVLQRADPHVLLHSDGWYYFTATVPEYDRLELRRARSLDALPAAEARVIWRKHPSGAMGSHIWAPEIHHIDGKWYVYFAAGSAEKIWDIRIYALENASLNPLEGEWIERGQIRTDCESFALDATTFLHRGVRYLVWAQKDPQLKGNTNLYIARMDTPVSIAGRQVMISRPEYDWEQRLFWVNEGPSVLVRNGRVVVSYSASGTDFNYCLGLLSAGAGADLLDPRSWTKSPRPVFQTSEENGIYGPGHNCFTTTPDGKTDLLVYHARSYREIRGDPLQDPNRHTRVQELKWKADGTPDFGIPAAEPKAPMQYAIGADLSFLRQAEEQGTRFKDGGIAKPGLQIFKDHGYNWIRLRLFHSPDRLPNNLDYTLAAAREARALGFKFLLNYHYSDTWADPGKQYPPKEWEGKTHAELARAVFEYTRDTVAAFRAAGAMPDMVQIGNEVTPGMLWPDGKLPQNWDNFGDLLKAGLRGVEIGRGDAPRPRIMIHIDKSGDRARTQWFFDNLIRLDVKFDVIGQSYYPWWHGTLLDLRETLEFMAERYRKEIILVEVAYNWREAEYRNRPAPFPESPQGQREFLEEVHRLVLATPHGLGKGIFWWEPAVTGRLRNRGMFDDDGNALPVISVFDRYTRGRPAKQ